jgi:hypothetical protein
MENINNKINIDKTRQQPITSFFQQIVLTNDENTLRTVSGYRKKVDRNQFVQWVEQSWDNIANETIKNSFNNLRRGLEDIEVEFLIN